MAAEFEEANPGRHGRVSRLPERGAAAHPHPERAALGRPARPVPGLGPGGELRTRSLPDTLKDISDDVNDELDAIGPTVNGWQVDGKTYGLPFTFGIEGFWYNKDLFEQAGHPSAPTTLDELERRRRRRSRPPASFPSPSAPATSGPPPTGGTSSRSSPARPRRSKAAVARSTSATRASSRPARSSRTFLGSSRSRRASSAPPPRRAPAARPVSLANGQAAMELMGHWNAGVIGGLTADKKVPGVPRLVPVPGHRGRRRRPDRSARRRRRLRLLGSRRRPECVDLLEYIMSDDVQKRFAESGAGIPTVADAADSAVEDPNLQIVARGQAERVATSSSGSTPRTAATVGNAMNDGIVNLFAGKGTPEGHRHRHAGRRGDASSRHHMTSHAPKRSGPRSPRARPRRHGRLDRRRARRRKRLEIALFVGPAHHRLRRLRHPSRGPRRRLQPLQLDGFGPLTDFNVPRQLHPGPHRPRVPRGDRQQPSSSSCCRCSSRVPIAIGVALLLNRRMRGRTLLRVAHLRPVRAQRGHRRTVVEAAPAARRRVRRVPRGDRPRRHVASSGWPTPTSCCGRSSAS